MKKSTGEKIIFSGFVAITIIVIVCFFLIKTAICPSNIVLIVKYGSIIIGAITTLLVAFIYIH